MYPQFRFQVFRECRTWQKLKASKGMNKTSTKLRKCDGGSHCHPSGFYLAFYAYIVHFIKWYFFKENDEKILLSESMNFICMELFLYGTIPFLQMLTSEALFYSLWNDSIRKE